MLTATLSGLSGRATLLSTLLAHPIDSDQMWQIRGESFGGQWDRTSPEATRALALLRESAAAREDLARIAGDYQRLFGGDPPRIDPRESAYNPDVDPEELRALYVTSGASMPWELEPDHISSELAYLAQLPLISANATHDMTAFARDHLRSWAPVCLAEMSLRAGSLLYQGVGALAMDFIESLPVH
ncbi:chaperone TorD involved in molybdoenzyme TorA maturation [Ruaniaceae bacterium KH17]|nr:chaperone TorD involved in molybdoenzyme TorA maturation [Ruaniaceae bacterium KH17]